MATNSLSQLLGYSTQYPKVSALLLNCKSNDSVCIIKFGKVGLIKSYNSQFSQEDHYFLRGCPMTDKSSELEMPFFNQTCVMIAGSFNPSSYSFVLDVGECSLRFSNL